MHLRALAAIVVIGAVTYGGGSVVFTNRTTTVQADCPGGYYANSDGQCVPDPSSGGAPGGAAGIIGGPPAGATAQCRDGKYSFSTHHTGTCSGHGGVSQWLTSS
jgi:hypothetical protein